MLDRREFTTYISYHIRVASLRGHNWIFILPIGHSALLYIEVKLGYLKKKSCFQLE